MEQESSAQTSHENSYHTEYNFQEIHRTSTSTSSESTLKSKKSRQFAVVLVSISALLALFILIILYKNDKAPQPILIHTIREPSPCLGHTDPLQVERRNTAHFRRHAIILDAGSQGTRLHIYELEFCNNLLVAVHNDFFASVPVSLSSLVSTPNLMIIAAKIIDPLLSKAIQIIPSEEHPNTPVALRATAGLRLLLPEQIEALLIGARNAIEKYPFLLVYNNHPAVDLISGISEGIWAWITINFLYKNLANECSCLNRPTSSDSPTLNPSITTTNSVIDLGGASLQVISEISEDEAQMLALINARLTGERSEPPPVFVHPVHFQERQYLVFVYSFLNYGYQTIRASLALRITNGALGTTFVILKEPSSEQLLEFDHRLIASIENPCIAEGHPTKTFFMGMDEVNMTLISFRPSPKASWGACCAAMRNIFDFETCDYPQCSFGGIPLPRSMLRRLNEVINVSSHFSAVLGPLLRLLSTYGAERASSLPLWSFWKKRSNENSHRHKDISLADIERIGRIICSSSFTPIKYPDIFEQFDNSHSSILENLCTDLSYIYILMTEGFRLPKKGPSSILRVEKESIGKAYPCWTLGAAMSLFRAEEH